MRQSCTPQRRLPARSSWRASRPPRLSTASTSAAAGDPIATGAVERGEEVLRRQDAHVTSEAGLQALDPKNFSGPLWEKLTGVKVRVVEAPFAEIYTKAIAEHIAKSGAIDVIEARRRGSPTSPTAA